MAVQAVVPVLALAAAQVPLTLVRAVVMPAQAPLAVQAPEPLAAVRAQRADTRSAINLGSERRYINIALRLESHGSLSPRAITAPGDDRVSATPSTWRGAAS